MIRRDVRKPADSTACLCRVHSLTFSSPVTVRHACGHANLQWHTQLSPATTCMDSHRRKLRKGTHSCSECRRRKVKCVFARFDSITCLVCERRGSRCTSQADSPASAIPNGDDNVRDQADALSPPLNNSFATPSPTAASIAGGPWNAKVHRCCPQCDSPC